jgi:hypothetical protein
VQEITSSTTWCQVAAVARNTIALPIIG